jgi:hypothetical protein
MPTTGVQTRSRALKRKELEQKMQLEPKFSQAGERFVHDMREAYALSDEEARGRWDKESNKPKGESVYLIQVDYKANGGIDLDGREKLARRANFLGYDEVDSSMSRVAFKTTPQTLDFTFFETAMRGAAEIHDVCLKRVLFIEDPGLGLCLMYPEDRPQLPRLSPPVVPI